MQILSKILEGKKTYIGIIIAVIGMTSLTQYISPEEMETTMKAIFELVGITLAVYGRAVART